HSFPTRVSSDLAGAGKIKVVTQVARVQGSGERNGSVVRVGMIRVSFSSSVPGTFIFFVACSFTVISTKGRDL
ncbi:MAG: hypothetical protein NTX06_13155, partial [Proteobacteria bacterium]|nr:hypothetical protein [Pseudomonadota bacterium]